MAIIWAFVVVCLAYLFPIIFFSLIASFIMGIFGLFSSRSHTSKMVNNHFSKP